MFHTPRLRHLQSWNACSTVAVMDTPQHTNHERILIAMLTGTASRHASKTLNNRYNQTEAITELHAISDNPHLLAHATRGTTDHLTAATRTLLLAAGATAADIDNINTCIDRRAERGMPLARIADQIR